MSRGLIPQSGRLLCVCWPVAVVMAGLYHTVVMAGVYHTVPWDLSLAAAAAQINAATGRKREDLSERDMM